MESSPVSLLHSLRKSWRSHIIDAALDVAHRMFSDGGVDFILLQGVNTYESTFRLLDRWYPKLRQTGIVAGDGYVDGVWEGVAFGVKRAVDEFAAAWRLQIHVTFDMPPTWFARQRRWGETPLNVAVLTAHDQNQADLAALSTPNKAAYCARHAYTFIERTDGFAPSRPAAWSKIRFLKEALRHHDWVFWSDADSLIMNGAIRLEEFVDDSYDLILTHEDLGQGVYNANTGQMLIRHGKWSTRFLDDVWSQRQFIHDRLWENRAAIHLLWSRDLSRHVAMVTQRRFNSYQGNYRDGDFILHLAGMPHEQRLLLMRRFWDHARP